MGRFNWLPQTLRGRLLTLFGSALFVTLLLVTVGVFAFVRATEQRAWQGRQGEAAINAAQDVRAFVSGAQEALQLAAIQVLEAEARGQVMRAGSLLLSTRGNNFTEVVVTNRDGDIIASALQGGEPSLANSFTIPQANWFVQARQGRVYLSQLLQDVNGQPYLIMSLPTEVGGVVAGRLRMEVLQRVAQEVRFGDTGTTILLNGEGQVLADRNPEDVLRGVTLAGRPEMLGIQNATDSWTGSYTNIANRMVVGAAVRVPLTTNWWLLTEVDRAEAFRNSTTAALLLGAISVGIWAGFMLLTSRFLDSFLFRRLRALQGGAQQVESGDLTHRIPADARDEIGAVTGAFNAMVATVQQRTAEREQLVRDLQLTTQQAQESARIKSEFLSTMSHELRTPLNAITGYAGIMLEGMGGELDAEAMHLLGRIQENSRHLLSLINDILDLSKAEAGRVDIQHMAFIPRDLAYQWRNQMAVLAERKGLTLDIQLDPTLPDIIYGDPDRLTQVAINLISNAIKFTEQGGVQVDMRARGRYWELAVKDTGIGIPPDALDYIFDEFRQVDGSSRRAHGGTGLGLAIVRNLCRLMGGSISVSSQVGVGSTFTVLLPLETDEPAQDMSPLAIIGAGQPA